MDKNANMHRIEDEDVVHKLAMIGHMGRDQDQDQDQGQSWQFPDGPAF